jgi:hypothetical protein
MRRFRLVAVATRTVEGPPPGGPPRNQGDFAFSTALVHLAAAVGTDDTVVLGFGLEAIADPAERAAVLGGVLDHVHQDHRAGRQLMTRWLRRSTVSTNSSTISMTTRRVGLTLSRLPTTWPTK